MLNKIKISNKKISIIGLGYVGLPLATEFAKKYKVNPFDISDLASEKQLAAGQDDLLMNIAHNLSIKKNK